MGKGRGGGPPSGRRAARPSIRRTGCPPGMPGQCWAGLMRPKSGPCNSGWRRAARRPTFCLFAGGSRALPPGVVLKKVAGDGNCLFHSIAGGLAHLGVDQSSLDASLLLAQVTAHLRRHEKKYIKDWDNEKRYGTIAKSWSACCDAIAKDGAHASPPWHVCSTLVYKVDGVSRMDALQRRLHRVWRRGTELVLQERRGRVDGLRIHSWGFFSSRRRCGSWGLC